MHKRSSAVTMDLMFRVSGRATMFRLSSTMTSLSRFAFVQQMKAQVGLLSDRMVLRSKMEGPRPDKFRTGKAVRFDAENG